MSGRLVQLEEAAAESQSTDAPANQIMLDPERLRRFLVGFLLAAAFFLVEAGVAEIALARNAACVDSLARFRLAPNPEQYCMSELGRQVAASVSRAAFDGETPQVLVWGLLAIGYGLLGGAFGQLSPRRALAGYLIVHLLLLIGFTSVGYLSQFIV